MATFLTKLRQLLEQAEQEEILDAAAAVKLQELAADRERNTGILSLAAVLGWLGGLVIGAGVILLVASNWKSFSDEFKVGMAVTLVAIAHGAGVWLRYRTRYYALAEALSFLGAIFFLATEVLVLSIYDIQTRPPNVFLLWLLATAPAAWVMRSVTLAATSLTALLIYLHFEQFEAFRTTRDPSFALTALVELGIGAGLVGFAALLREKEPPLAALFRGVAVLLLFYAVYMLGFYRHLAWYRPDWISTVPAAGALLFAIAGLALGYRRMLPENRYLRDRLVILLSACLAVGLLMAFSDLRLLPGGPKLQFFNYGGFRNFTLTEWLLSVAAWVLWFALGMWCVLFASRTNRKAYLNAGVLSVGLGVITRFFDLAGGLFQTGMIFVVGGTVLLVTCVAIERWRRHALRVLKQADEARKDPP